MHYELIVIYTPEQAEEDAGQSRKSLEDIAAKTKAKVVETEDWGERQLSYEIKGFERAPYVLYMLDMDEKTAKSIRDRMKMAKGILRWMLIKSDKSILKEDSQKDSKEE